MFESFPLWLNLLLFAISAGIIWCAGTYLEHLANTISRRTKWGQAFTGVLILSAATSLPELATTTTAIVFLDNPTLAVHNLLGGVALQTAILVGADAVKKSKGALTFFSPKFVLLIEGVGVIVLLQLVIVGISTKGFPVLFDSMSIWPVLLFLVYIAIMYLSYRNEEHPRWKPDENNLPPEQDLRHKKNQEDRKFMQYSMKKVWLLFAIGSIVVLIAGWSTAQAADVLAKQTGLGSAFLGATLLALATSLPELSTTFSAARNRHYSMAISNVFGSNAFDVGLLFLAEILYLKGTVIENTRESVLFVAGIGAIMTAVYLWGLMERENKNVLGIGIDSAACIFIYMGAMTVLYFMN